MIDVVADEGWLATTIQTITLLQMVIQGYWHHDDCLCTLPFMESHHINALRFVHMVFVLVMDPVLWLPLATFLPHKSPEIYIRFTK